MLTSKGHFLLLLLVAGLLLKGPTAVAGEPGDGQIRALYVYNFLLFVDWPEEALARGETIRVAVIGDSDLFSILAGMAKTPVKGREVAVEHFESPEDLPWPCHVVFVGAAKRDVALRIIRGLGDRPVLSISDAAGFTELGGMVYLKHVKCEEHTHDHPKRLEINLPAVKRAGLKIRSRLLRLSDIVE